MLPPREKLEKSVGRHPPCVPTPLRPCLHIWGSLVAACVVVCRVQVGLVSTHNPTRRRRRRRRRAWSTSSSAQSHSRALVSRCTSCEHRRPPALPPVTLQCLFSCCIRWPGLDTWSTTAPLPLRHQCRHRHRHQRLLRLLPGLHILQCRAAVPLIYRA